MWPPITYFDDSSSKIDNNINQEPWVKAKEGFNQSHFNEKIVNGKVRTKGLPIREKSLIVAISIAKNIYIW